MRTVFLDLQTFSPDVSLSAIETQVSSLTTYPLTRPEQVVRHGQDAEILITNKVVLGRKELAQLPQLKLICVAATGTNNIDLAAAREFGVAVTNVSDYAGNSVAQYVFSQILEYFSQTSHNNQNTDKGLWQKSPTFCHHGNKIQELAGKKLGIVGFGHLGQSVAKIAAAFDMQILIAERPEASRVREGRMAFEEVVKQSDILSLHCPQTPKTENLINAQVLKLMKPGAMLINSARGAIIDEAALLTALKNRKIGYAVLDVLSQEPPPAGHILLDTGLDNLKITAHIAWASIEAQQRLLNLIADNIDAYRHNRQLNRLDC